MSDELQLKVIGYANIENGVYFIQLKEAYAPALKNIQGYSHLQIVSWAHLCDHNRTNLVLEKPFINGPERIGVFATRAPVRPNPIMISTINVSNLDINSGRIFTKFIDVADKTPVLDIKPYNKMERVKNCRVPKWCSHWPQWYEEANQFNWKDEINFEL